MISYIPKARMLRTKRLRYRGNSRLFQAVRQLTACETEHVRMAWRVHCARACPALPWNMRRAVRKERCCTRSSLRNSKHSCEGSKTGIEPYRILSNRNFGLFWTVASWRAVFLRLRCQSCGHDRLLPFSCYPQRETIRSSRRRRAIL